MQSPFFDAVFQAYAALCCFRADLRSSRVRICPKRKLLPYWTKVLSHGHVQDLYTCGKLNVVTYTANKRKEGRWLYTR